MSTAADYGETVTGVLVDASSSASSPACWRHADTTHGSRTAMAREDRLVLGHVAAVAMGFVPMVVGLGLGVTKIIAAGRPARRHAVRVGSRGSPGDE